MLVMVVACMLLVVPTEAFFNPMYMFMNSDILPWLLLTQKGGMFGGQTGPGGQPNAGNQMMKAMMFSHMF